MTGTRLTVRQTIRQDADLDGQALVLAERVRDEGYAKGFLRFEAPPLPMMGRSWSSKGVRVVVDGAISADGAATFQADTDAFSDRWEGQ